MSHFLLLICVVSHICADSNHAQACCDALTTGSFAGTDEKYDQVRVAQTKEDEKKDETQEVIEENPNDKQAKDTDPVNDAGQPEEVIVHLSVVIDNSVKETSIFNCSSEPNFSRRTFEEEHF